ncbi:HTH tetR-type domain-containing protein [Cupriavidus oxalaticus]|uniref:TetR/AcrR family transcriptional regulator n=1 Tax=Cupriavidus oxalaticus TaxID=96344 RepID=UPI003F740092
MKEVTRTRRSRTNAGIAEEEVLSLSTRDRILDAAVNILVEQGSARTTTLEVQRKAGVSRGALLHHFPTHASLLSATVEGLVRRNEQSVLESLERLEGLGDAVEKAIRVLAIATVQPAYLAELELWAVSRTDPELRATLLEAERNARKESERVVKKLFDASSDNPAQASVVAMTMEFLRGLALSGVLRSSPVRRQQLITQWIQATKILMETRR